jgi:hypothetical protein
MPVTDPRIAAVISSARKKGGRPPGSKTVPKAERLRRELAELEAQDKLKKSPGSPAVAPAAVPVAAPPPENVISPASDKTLFGNTPNFDRPPEHFMGDGNGPQPSPIPEEMPEPENGNIFGNPINSGASDSPPKEEPQADPESHRPFAGMIWDSVINMLAVFVHPCWLPRKIGNNSSAGEIPYDERDAVIISFCKYLQHLGMVMLSPGQEFALSVANYSLPRLFISITVLKQKLTSRKKHGPKPEPHKDPRTPENAKDVTPEPKTP